MKYLEIHSTDRDAIDKLDTLFSQVRGKAAKQGNWHATYQTTPDGVTCLAVTFYAQPVPPPTADTTPATTDTP